MTVLLRLEDLRIATLGFAGAGMHIHPRLLRPRLLDAGDCMESHCRLQLRLQGLCRSCRPLVAASSRGAGLVLGRLGRLGYMGEGRSWLGLSCPRRGMDQCLIADQPGARLEVVEGSCWFVVVPGRQALLCLWVLIVSWVFGHSDRLDLRLQRSQVVELQSSWVVVVGELALGLSQSGP